MFVFLIILWFIFNGRLGWDVLISGLLVCAALEFFCQKVLGFRKEKFHQLFLSGKEMILYVGFLVKEMFIATMQMVKIVLSPKAEISPTLITFNPNLKTAEGRVLLANSITLTPGTINVECNAGQFWVHAITEQAALDCVDSVMSQKIKKMEEKIEA